MIPALIMFMVLGQQAPPQVEAMNDLPNAAELHLVYCLKDKVCVQRRAICYGQCGDQENGDEMGYGCSGNIVGTVPSGYKYTSWFAIDYETGKRVSGRATKNYHPWGGAANCHPRDSKWWRVK